MVITCAGCRLLASRVLVIETRLFRAIRANRAASHARLITLIRLAAEPKPRHKTKPTREAKGRWLERKMRREKMNAMRSVTKDE